jgi:carboxylate-amine ligase
MIATLIRALVARAMRDAADGQPEPVIPQETVEHACWLAARHGTSEELLDLSTPQNGTARLPAARMLDQLVEHVSGGAVHEDMEYVLPRLDGALVNGGAVRQRAAFSDHGTAGLIDMLQQPHVTV